MAAAIEVGFELRSLLSFAAAANALSAGQMQRIARESLMAAGGKARTQVRRALREQTGVKAAKDINDRTHSFTMSGELAYRIEGLNKVLALDRVQGLAVKTGSDGGVAAAPWQVLRQFQRSFVIMKDGERRYVARLPGEGRTVRTLFGPSVMKELVKDESRAVFERVAPIELEAQVLARLERAMAR